MEYEIRVPKSAMPKKDPDHPCPCQFREFQIREKKGEITEWLVEEGGSVKKGQVICEGEVEKKHWSFIRRRMGFSRRSASEKRLPSIRGTCSEL